MQLRAELQIATAIKAMQDVIIPAIDPVNKLALEQSQLVMGMLALMARQGPLQFRFDCDELGRLIDHATRFDELPATGPALERLKACRGESAELLARCTVEPTALTEQVRALRQAMTDAVAAINADASPQAQTQVERIVLALSREQLLRDRALMKQQGWEPEPDKVPDIEQLLAPLAAPGR